MKDILTLKPGQTQTLKVSGKRVVIGGAPALVSMAVDDSRPLPLAMVSEFERLKGFRKLTFENHAKEERRFTVEVQ